MGKKSIIALTGWCLLVVAACESKIPKAKPTSKVVASLIHPLLFQEEIATQLNFPFWFNDSIVREQQLETINWTVFSTFPLDPDQPADPDTYPKTKWTFHFSETGSLQSLERYEYSEGIEISIQQFCYGKLRSGGFRDISRQGENLDRETPDVSTIQLRPLAPKTKVLQFDHLFEDVRYHFFANKKLWGALSVDSIARPGRQDWVIWGTPSHPVKRYQVTNTVSERNVTKYTYVKDNYPATASWTDYPFTQERVFHYSGSGIFKGFTDSTFIDGAFVTRTITTFKLDGHKRPVEIIHQKGHASGETNYRTIEKIVYEVRH